MGRRGRRRGDRRSTPGAVNGPRAREDTSLDALLVEQFLAFREKFGRDPGPDDPVIFDPHADEPMPMSYEDAEAAIVAAAQVVGIDPALIYAMQMTGLLLTDESADLVDVDELEEWLDAVDRYRRLHGQSARPAYRRRMVAVPRAVEACKAPAIDETRQPSGGLFDHLGWRVSGAQAPVREGRLTETHEYFHRQLDDTSSFGSLMATIAALAEATLDETWVDALRRLEAMSDLVHETYAVGASLLTTQRPVANIDGYPTYDQYVRAVRRVCGPSVHPWVALAAVRSAALACMQPRSPIKLARRSLETFDPRSIPRLERPNHRLAVLLDGRFAKCVAREHERCQRSFGDAPWWQPAGGISLHPDSMDGEAGAASHHLQLRLLADATDLLVAAGGQVAPFDSHHDDLRSLLTQAQAIAPGNLPRIGALIESASSDLLHGGPLDSQTVSLRAAPRRAAVLPYGSASGVSGQDEHAHIFVALTTTRRLESAFQLEGVPLPPGPVLAVVRNTIYDGDRRDMVLLQPVEDPRQLDDSVPVYVSVLSSAAGASPELNETWSRSQSPSQVSLVMDTPVTASLRTWCRHGASFHTATRVVEVGDDHIWLIFGRVRAATRDESPLVLIPTTEFGARWFEAARAEDQELGASVIDDDDLLDREGRHLDVLIHHTILEERSLGPGSWRH